MKTPITGWVKATDVIDKFCETCCEYRPYCQKVYRLYCQNDPVLEFPEWVADRAREDERFPDIVKKALAEAKELPPYKGIGTMESYSDYNQGWADAINYVSSKIGIDY